MEYKKGNLKNIDISIFENIGGIFITFTFDGQLTHTNSQFSDQLGYEFPEIDSLSMWVIVDPKHHKKIRDQILYIGSSHDSASGFVNLRCKNADILQCYYSFSYVLDSDENPLIIGIFREAGQMDYEEQVYEQKSQLASERLMLTSIIEKNPYAIGIFDKEGFLLEGNLEFKQLWGGAYPVNYNILQDQTFFITQDKNQVINHITQHSLTKTILFNPRSYSSSYPDRPYWIQITLFSVKDQKDKLHSIIVMYKDINEQVETKLTLQEYQRHLEDLVADRTKELQSRLKFEKIISDISSGFVGRFSIQKSIQFTLSEIGDFVKADRAVLLLFDPEKIKEYQFGNIFEWKREGLNPIVNKTSEMSFLANSKWDQLLEKNKIISIDDTTKLEPQFQKILPFLNTLNARSILALPLHLQDSLIGFIALSNDFLVYHWKEIHFSLLQLTVEILSTVFERTKAENALDKEKKTLNNVIQLNPYGIIIFDVEGNFIQSNAAFRKFLPINIDANFNIFKDSYFIEQGISAKLIKVKQGRTVSLPEFEFDLSRASRDLINGIKTFRAISFPLYTERDAIKRFVVMIEDMTEIKLAEEAKIQSEQKYLGLFKNSAIGIGIVSRGGSLLEVNDTLAKMILYSKEEISTLDIFALHRDPNYSQKIVQKLKKHPNGATFELQLYRKDNSTFWAIIVIRLILYEGETAYIITVMDINDRIVAEKMQKRQEKQFRLIFENSPFPMIIFNKDLDITQISPQFIRQFGYDLSDIPRIALLFEKMDSATHGSSDILEIWQQDLEKLKIEQFIEHKFILFSKDDGIHEVNTKLVNLDEEHYLYILEDFTEFNDTQRALEKSEEKYRLIVETSNDIIFTVDKFQQFQFINNAFTRITGYTLDDVLNTSADIYVHPEDKKKFEHLNDRMKRGELIKRLEYRIYSKSGDILYLSANIHPIFDDNGEILAIYASARDISEEIRVQMEKEKTEELYRRVVETSDDIIFICDLEGNYKFLNSANSRVLGYSIEELMQLNGFSLIHPDDVARVRRDFQDLYVGERIYNISYRFRHKNGRFLFLSTNGTPLTDAGNNVTAILGIARNMTTIRQKDREIREKEVRIQHSQVTSMISSMLVHDLGKIQEKINDILKTVGNSIGNEIILLIRHIKDQSSFTYDFEGKWVKKNKVLSEQLIENLMDQEKVISYMTRVPKSIYKMINIEDLQFDNVDEYIENGIHEILLIPIFQSQERYGTLMLVSPGLHEFDQRKISLCLNVALLIGLGLENTFSQSMLNQLFQTLSNLTVGVYIIQPDERGLYPFVYANQYFCQIWGLTEQEILGMDTYGDLIGEEIKEKFEILTRARLAGKEFPHTYSMTIPYKGENKELMFSVSSGMLNGRNAIFGMVTEFKAQEIPTFDEVLEKYLL